MVITGHDTYLDGGTVAFNGSNMKMYCFDFRMDSLDHGAIWEGYPDKSDSRRLSGDELESVQTAVENYFERVEALRIRIYTGAVISPDISIAV